MDLLRKTGISAIILILLIVGFYVFTQKFVVQQVTQVQAQQQILNYIKNAYPNAVVNISNSSPSQYPGSWHIFTSLILNATSPCPSYYSYSFDYPKYGFVYRVENIYTDKCVIYGLQQNSSYLITSSPVAIVRSYNLNIPAIISYLNKFSHSSVNVYATYYPTIPYAKKVYTNVWIVNYTSVYANYSVYVLLRQAGGNEIVNYTLSH